MYCKYCGKQVADDSKFCSYCGSNIVEVNTETIITQEPKVWGVFARIGFGLGLGGLIGCILSGIGFIFCIPGLVFSILGKKSLTYNNKAKTGFVLSLVGLILGFIIYVWTIIIISV